MTEFNHVLSRATDILFDFTVVDFFSHPETGKLWLHEDPSSDSVFVHDKS